MTSLRGRPSKIIKVDTTPGRGPARRSQAPLAGIPLSRREKDEIDKLSKERVPASEIAQRLGRGKTTVNDYIRGNIPPEERGQNPAWSEDEIATLSRMLADGAKTKEISEKIGRTASAVRIKASKLRRDAQLEEPQNKTSRYPPAWDRFPE